MATSGFDWESFCDACFKISSIFASSWTLHRILFRTSASLNHVKDIIVKKINPPGNDIISLGESKIDNARRIMHCYSCVNGSMSPPSNGRDHLKFVWPSNSSHGHEIYWSKTSGFVFEEFKLIDNCAMFWIRFWTICYAIRHQKKTSSGLWFFKTARLLELLCLIIILIALRWRFARLTPAHLSRYFQKLTPLFVQIISRWAMPVWISRTIVFKSGKFTQLCTKDMAISYHS